MRLRVATTSWSVLRNRLYSTVSPHTSYRYLDNAKFDLKNQLVRQCVAFPLPGDVGFSQKHHPKPQNKRLTVLDSSKITVQDLLLNGRFYVDLEHVRDAQPTYESLPEIPVEVSAQSCPRLLKREMKNLFPQINVANANVINLSQETKTDQSAWSPEMAAEHQALSENFVSYAKAVCLALKDAGYWADFIHPEYGQPFYNSVGKSDIFEKNDVYAEMGFEIEDLGCCKILKHAKWGTHAFVGTIFTDAPLHSEVVRNIVEEYVPDDGHCDE